MISVQKRIDKILTYDVILWPWHHRNDSCPPEMKSVELHGHFDTHKGHMKSFHPDFKFCHVANIAKKGWSRGFPWKPPTLIVFYAHENPRTTSSVQPWATLRDFVSFVMLAEFYPGITNNILAAQTIILVLYWPLLCRLVRKNDNFSLRRNVERNSLWKTWKKKWLIYPMTRSRS